jgi:hypothetical protein
MQIPPHYLHINNNIGLCLVLNKNLSFFMDSLCVNEEKNSVILLLGENGKGRRGAFAYYFVLWKEE